MRRTILTAAVIAATLGFVGAAASGAKAQGVVVVGGFGPSGIRAPGPVYGHRHHHGCGHHGWDRDHRDHGHGRWYDDGRRYYRPGPTILPYPYPYPVAPRGVVIGGYYGWVPTRPW